MPTLTSARPDALLLFVTATSPPTASLDAEASALVDALAAVRTAFPAGWGPPTLGVGDRARGHARGARAVAQDAALAAAAFAAAGGPLLALAVAAVRAMDDDEVAAVVAAALGVPPGASGARSGADPDAVALLATTVGPAALGRLAATHPHLVGPVDGMPPAARYVANRTLIAEAAASAEARGDDDRADALRELLRPGRQILLFDPTGDGRVAEVFGDLEGAENIAVVVPGMANDLQNFDRHTASKGRAVHRAAGTGTAVIAWLGYDSPDGGSAVLDDAAGDGADGLLRLVDGLSNDARRTVIGHSYGTVVTAEALRRGLEVDQVVVTGSPGMLEDDAETLAGDIPIWVARAPGDVVGWSENFGRDPSDPRFGASRIDTGELLGHDGYFDMGSESLANIGRIVAGRTDEVTLVAAGMPAVVVATAADAQSALDPTDELQAVVADGAGVVSGVVDGIESVLPAPVAAVVDGTQDAAGIVLEVGNRGVDLRQRLTSVDLWGDLALDGIDLLADHADDAADRLGDAVGDVADRTGDVVGGAADRFVDGARRLGGLLG